MIRNTLNFLIAFGGIQFSGAIHRAGFEQWPLFSILTVLLLILNNMKYAHERGRKGARG